MKVTRLILVTTLTILTIGASACSAGSGNEKTPVEQATAEDLEYFQLRIEPMVWHEIQLQAWFNGGNPTPDGRRLMALLSDYWLGQRAYNTIQVLNAYPEGLSEEIEQALLSLESGYLVQNIAESSWIADGIDGHESAFLDALGNAWKREGPAWTFKQTLLDAIEMPWFVDGIDETEIAVLAAASAMSGRDQEGANQLVMDLQDGSFSQHALALNASGEKVLILTTASRDLLPELEAALPLMEQWAQPVEDFGGFYEPRYVVVALEEESDDLCGTAVSHRGDVPGVISLRSGCVDHITAIHEIAHLMIGSGPIWFAEGIADLAVLHLTGESSSYLARDAAGLIQLRGRWQAGEDFTSAYFDQGALGARLLARIYQLIGPDKMSAIVSEVASGKYPQEGDVILKLILDGTPEELQPQVMSLLEENFDTLR
jgi:hypothetical protein